MIKVRFDSVETIAFLEPEDSCSSADLEACANELDAYVDKGGEIQKIVLSIESYDHWEVFGKSLEGFKPSLSVTAFIEKVAIITDNPVFDTGSNLSAVFDKATLFIYSFCEYDQAMDWIREPASEQETID